MVRIITMDTDANSDEDERIWVGEKMGGQLILLYRSRNFGNVMLMGMTGGEAQ